VLITLPKEEYRVRLLIFLILVIIGAFFVNYDLGIIFHHTVSFFWAFVISLITGSTPFWLAIVLKILVVAGVITR
jgi:hypothetical protein